MAEDTTLQSQDSAISTCLRSVIAAILLDNGVDDLEDHACLGILEQIMLKSCMKHAALTQSFAEHAMRVQAHFADAVMAVAFTGFDVSRLKTYAKDYKIPKAIDGLRLVPEQAPPPPAPVVFQSGEQRRLPRYIPDYFPPMPSIYTFESTPVHKQNKLDYKQVREKLATERRQVEKSLIHFHLRTVGHFDNPFQLKDPCFSLLPAKYGMDEPAYIKALACSKFEDRRTEEHMRIKNDSALDKSRDEDETRDPRDDGPPRKYRRHKPGEKKTGEKKIAKSSKKSMTKAGRNKEDIVEESNSASGF